jgi:hypothetical protein
MSKRNEQGKYARKASGWVISLYVFGGLLGMGSVYAVGRFLGSNLVAFRSCSHNNDGLSIANCGKQGLNSGDWVLILLFLLCAALTFVLFKRAWKLSRRGAPS